MDVEFDGGSDLRVFENKKKMIYKIISASASARAKIAHWVGMNTLVTAKKAAERVVRICPENPWLSVEMLKEYSRELRTHFHEVPGGGGAERFQTDL